MKQFLYLDSDIVDSIIAQKEKGLIKEASREQQQSSSTVDGTTSSTSIGGVIGGSVFDLFKWQGQIDKSDTRNSESSSQWAYRNVITKTLHDAAFDIAMDNVKPVTSLTQLQFGSYVEIKNEFVFADFKYLEAFFAKGGLYETMLKMQTTSNKNSSSSSNGQPQKKDKNTIRSKTDELREICNLARGIVPYDRMLISNEGFIIPLENKYFRVNPEGIAFKYGGMTTCVGKITNIIEQGQQPASSDLFSTLQYNLNDTLFDILEIKQDKMYVVHPIAVYFEA